MTIEPVLRLGPLPGSSPDERWHLLESTASVEVDRPPEGAPDGSMDARIGGLARRIADEGGDEPSVLVFVHGYSNDERSVLARLQKARAASAEPSLSGTGTFWVGYRWPSETILSPWRTVLPGLSGALAAALGLGASALALGLLSGRLAAAFLGWGVLASALGAVGRRAVACYRDSWRASNHGVPDLVEFVRRLDRALARAREGRPETPRVRLSFVGHSMGGFVVTDALRILSDVFDPGSIRAVDAGGFRAVEAASAPPAPEVAMAPAPLAPEPAARTAAPAARAEGPSPDLGASLRLDRLVLVSPDVPAVALVTGRANALGSSIRRCREAHLAGNGGDVVPSAVSRTANRFAYPAGRAAHAARLGNAQVVSAAPGVLAPPGDLLRSLRLGGATLRTLQRACARDADADAVAAAFAYVDCAGFLAGGRLALSSSRGDRPLGFGSHARGLAQRLGATALGRGIDCHSGCFDHGDTLELVLGCGAMELLGLKARLAAQGRDLDAHVAEIGVRVSPGATLGL